MRNLKFAGHESFHVRNLWLKKGYDFITRQDFKRVNFNHNLAVINLGVGKNMVSSIRFWLKAFELIDETTEKPTWISQFLLDGKGKVQDKGKDPFIEDIGSIWLLHYHLVKASKASIYNLVFNHFRKQRIEFKKSHLVNFLVNECNKTGEKHSINTIEKDVGVFLKNYVSPESGQKRSHVEDHYASLFIDLGLIKRLQSRSFAGEEWYKIESTNRAQLPPEIFLYSILDNEHLGSSISLNKLLNEENSPGNIFALTPDELVKKVYQISKMYDGIVYKDDAGVRELQIDSRINKKSVLTRYYDRSN